MELKMIRVKNFKNLKDVTLKFNSGINFIIGDSNLGKSNFLDLLDILFNHNRNGFDPDSFNNNLESSEIRIQFTLKLNDDEKGLFDDYCDPCDPNNIKIFAFQKDKYSDLKFFFDPNNKFESEDPKDSENEISNYKISKINFFKYSSVRQPNKEISFYNRNSKIGKILRYLVDETLGDEKIDILNIETLNSKVKIINKTFISIMQPGSNLNIDYSDIGNESFLRLLLIKDENNYAIENSGYGTSFSLLLILDILEKLMEIKIENDKKHNNEDITLNTIIGLDEPEAHLPPIMQRNLIRYVHSIVSDEDNSDEVENLKDEIKNLFKIKNINSQMIIVTHSPELLTELENCKQHDIYRNIIRFYKEEQKTEVISGFDLNLDEKDEKNFYRIFPEIKNALFATRVLIVEGESEMGAFPFWFKKVTGKYLDDCKIIVIKSSGGAKDGVKNLSDMLSKFKIKTTYIYDRDNSDIQLEPNSTTEKDFEAEIIQTVFSSNNQESIKKFIGSLKKEILEGGTNKFSTKSFKNYSKYYKLNFEIGSTPNYDYNYSDLLNDIDSYIKNPNNFNNKDLLKIGLMTILATKKSLQIGRILGDLLEEEFIPKVYKDKFYEVIGL